MARITIPRGTPCELCKAVIRPGENVYQEKGTDKFAHAACLLKHRKEGQVLVLEPAQEAPVIPDQAKRFWKH